MGWLTIMGAFLDRENENLRVGYFKPTSASSFLNAW